MNSQQGIDIQPLNYFQFKMIVDYIQDQFLVRKHANYNSTLVNRQA